MNPSKLILLVEDNANDEFFIRKAMQKMNCPHQINIARDGQQALDLLDDLLKNITIKALPDLILLNINLPKINGLEVLKFVKENEYSKQIPIVMFTSSLEK